MTNPIAHDPITHLSILLRQLPFSPVIDMAADGRGTIMTTVTLRPAYGNPVSATAPSFAIAYTVALNQLRGAALVNHIDEVAQ
jgi:hypothetical protein